MIFFALVCLLLFNGFVQGQLTDPSTVQVGDTICYEGYVMDYFCIERGTLFDNPDVATLVNPGVHSVHCLLDVPDCVASPFEILGDPPDGAENPMFTRAYRVDDEGRDLLVEIAQAHGDCSSCTGSMVSERYTLVVRGFRAEVNGVVTNLSSTMDGVTIPVQIQLTNASRSNDATVICGVEQPKTTTAPAPSPTTGDNMGSSAPGMSVAGAFVTLFLAPLVFL